MVFRFQFFVESVYDGDTIRGVADLGLAVYLGREQANEYWKIRLYGINAAELRGPTREAGLVARDFLRQYVHPGDTLVVESYGWDKYERRIDGIPFTKDGVDLCQLLLQAGMAVPVDW